MKSDTADDAFPSSGADALPDIELDFSDEASPLVSSSSVSFSASSPFDLLGVHPASVPIDTHDEGWSLGSLDAVLKNNETGKLLLPTGIPPPTSAPPISGSTAINNAPADYASPLPLPVPTTASAAAQTAAPSPLFSGSSSEFMSSISSYRRRITQGIVSAVLGFTLVTGTLHAFDVRGMLTQKTVAARVVESAGVSGASDASHSSAAGHAAGGESSAEKDALQQEPDFSSVQPLPGYTAERVLFPLESCFYSKLTKNNPERNPVRYCRTADASPGVKKTRQNRAGVTLYNDLEDVLTMPGISCGTIYQTLAGKHFWISESLAAPLDELLGEDGAHGLDYYVMRGKKIIGRKKDGLATVANGDVLYLLRTESPIPKSEKSSTAGNKKKGEYASNQNSRSAGRKPAQEKPAPHRTNMGTPTAQAAAYSHQATRTTAPAYQHQSTPSPAYDSPPAYTFPSSPIASVLASFNQQHASKTGIGSTGAVPIRSAAPASSAAHSYCIFRGKMKSHETAQVGTLRGDIVTFYDRDGTALGTLKASPDLRSLADCNYASLNTAYAAAR